MAHNPERFRQRIEQTNLLDIDPDKLTPVDKIDDHLIRRADGRRCARERLVRRVNEPGDARGMPGH
jgi:hypothetical protein